MRILLTWIDQLRVASVETLPSFCAALVAQFTDLAAAANTWAAKDHNTDGTHYVVRVGGTTTDPAATLGQITIYTTDGTTLKVVKADGTIGTITVV